jgi:hypothetical protein
VNTTPPSTADLTVRTEAVFIAAVTLLAELRGSPCSHSELNQVAIRAWWAAGGELDKIEAERTGRQHQARRRRRASKAADDVSAQNGR